MPVQVIKNENQYQAALARVETLMDSDTQDALDELEVLGLLVENYEEDTFPIDLPSPIDAIRFRMEQQGLTASDMIPFLGSKSRVSEILNEKRPLTLKMMRRLHVDLGIPAEVLLGKPDAELPRGTSRRSDDSLTINGFRIAQ
jgi:HTH-type transcriptional regulator/antitoxin HigA